MKETIVNKAPEIGSKMLDGSVYAGVSPTTGKPMYTTTDTPLAEAFNPAVDYAKKLNAEKHLGHDDWRVPKPNEMEVLFNNSAKIGGFHESRFAPADSSNWYWTTSPAGGGAAVPQRQSDGYVKGPRSFVRCVR